MKLTRLITIATATASCVLAVAVVAHANGTDSKAASPIYGVTIPDGYRNWELIAPAQEAAPLNELRAVLGNRVAIRGIPRRDAAVSGRHGAGQAGLEARAVAGVRAGVDSRCGDDGAVHGQGLEKICGHRRLGLWSFHQRQTRRRGAASHLLRLSPGASEGPRLGVHAMGTAEASRLHRTHRTSMTGDMSCHNDGSLPAVPAASVARWPRPCSMPVTGWLPRHATPQR